jgi:hypothetical protein
MITSHNECAKISWFRCIVIDGLVNYYGYESLNTKLRALTEITETPESKITIEWIGMNGVIGMRGYPYEDVALRLLKTPR